MVWFQSALDAQKAWRAAHQAALDVVRYDQQGCYSPHLFYVQKGGKVTPQEFARYMATELITLVKDIRDAILQWKNRRLGFMAAKRRNERLFKQGKRSTWQAATNGRSFMKKRRKILHPAH